MISAKSVTSWLTRSSASTIAAWSTGGAAHALEQRTPDLGQHRRRLGAREGRDPNVTSLSAST
jgi:hypothetical protein